MTVQPFILTDVAVQIYNALILPHFHYCSLFWDCMSGYLSDKRVIIKHLGDAFDDLEKGNNLNCQIFFTCLLNCKKHVIMNI